MADYDKLYTKSFHDPKSYIKFSTPIDDCIGCPYNMDEKDQAWLALHIEKADKGPFDIEHILNEDQFEWIMWGFEKLTNDKVWELNASHTWLWN